MIDDLLDRVAELELEWLAAFAFFLPFGETVALLDVIVPGEVGLVLIGAAARTPPRLAVVFVMGSLGAFCGDSVSWFVGHRWGTSVLQRWPRLWRHAEPALGQAAKHFNRHGGRSIFFARFVGALRAIAPLVAGAAGLPFRIFAPWNAAASITWVGLMVLLGAVVGESVVSFIDRFGRLLSIAVVTALVVWFLRRRQRTRN
jgi:undecaprenyl-diphosphatase